MSNLLEWLNVYSGKSPSSTNFATDVHSVIPLRVSNHPGHDGLVISQGRVVKYHLPAELCGDMLLSQTETEMANTIEEFLECSKDEAKYIVELLAEHAG